MRVRLSNFQDAYLERHLHLSDEITYENAFIGIKLLMALPVFRSMWKRHRETYASELIQIVDQIIRDTPLATPADPVTQYKSDLKQSDPSDWRSHFEHPSRWHLRVGAT